MRSLRGTLLVLVLPPLVLLTGAGALVAWNHWSSQAAQAEAGLRQGALTLMRAVDRELMLDQVATETLASSPLLDRGDWIALRGMATQVAQRRDGMLFALVDAQGRSLFNTAQPADAAPMDSGPVSRESFVDWHGHALPRSSLPTAREALDADRPVYSDLYFGLVVQRPALAVVVPVRRAGRTAYALTCSFSPDDLSRLLQTDRPPGLLQVWMADRAGRLIASTSVGLESVGRSMPAPLLARLRGQDDGVVQLSAGTQTVDRVVAARVAVAAISPLTGWLLVIESTADDAYADARRLLVGWLLATLAVVAATAWVAARRAAQLSRPLLRLARSATQPLQARRVQRHAQQRPVEVREIAVLQQALQRADDSEQLRQEESLQLVLARERERLARKAAEDSRERETQLRLALEAGRMGFWRLDLTRRELTSDATHRQLWGLPGSPDRLPADLLSSRVHPDDQAAFLDAQRRAADGEHLRLEFRILLDGRVRWLHCEADAPPGAEGASPTTLLGVDLDVTEQRLLREALQERSRALERADQEKNRFLAMLGHELRNPLAPIRASADLLCRLASDRGDIARAAERVQRQAGHLTRLIDDLLDIGRITQGKIELRLAPVDLADVLREAVEAVRPLIDSRGHRLVLQGPSAPVHVRGDATRLLQVVANLLGNAAKYTDEGGKIRLTLAREGRHAVITVEDNGWGLPREALPTLFDPFTQVRGTLHRAEGGLGIGLAVVRRLVELHGGQVKAHSEGPGCGTTLTVWLPRAEPPGAGPAASTDASSAEAGGSGRRVLVVDDNQDGADSMAELLALAGHHARVAYSGSAALALADDFGPEVAVLDIGLPDLDGCELAAQLRARWPALRLIALTGRAGDDEDRRMREAGFHHRLVKPADADQVLDLLRETAPHQEKSP